MKGTGKSNRAVLIFTAVENRLYTEDMRTWYFGSMFSISLQFYMEALSYN